LARMLAGSCRTIVMGFSPGRGRPSRRVYFAHGTLPAMKRACLVFLALFLAAGSAAAEDKQPKKEKPAAKSDKNVFQKTESSVGEWANRNKIWVTHKKKSEKKN
jgi:hypothetical protein